jgi:hypothetical protein
MHDFVTEIWVSVVLGMAWKRSRSCRTMKERVSISIIEMESFQCLSYLALLSSPLRRRIILSDSS